MPSDTADAVCVDAWCRWVWVCVCVRVAVCVSVCVTLSVWWVWVWTLLLGRLGFSATAGGCEGSEDPVHDPEINPANVVVCTLRHRQIGKKTRRDTHVSCVCV
jgi:hypothetical protein